MSKSKKAMNRSGRGQESLQLQGSPGLVASSTTPDFYFDGVLELFTGSQPLVAYIRSLPEYQAAHQAASTETGKLTKAPEK